MKFFLSIVLSTISYLCISQCNANFSITSNNNGSVTFSNTSISSNPITYYHWFYGDGHSHLVIGTGQQTRNYHNGIYTAKLFLNDTIASCTSSISVTFTVNNAPCQGIVNDIIISQQAYGVCNLYPDVTGMGNYNYSWQYSDGNTSNGFNTSHTFTTSGLYTTTLTISDQLGICNYSFQKTFSVTVAPCTLTPSFTYSIGNNGLVTFQSTSTGTTATTSYYWTFGDFNSAYGSVVSNTYQNSGNYSVQLNVHDSINFTCTASTSQLVNLSNCVNHVSFNLFKDSTQLPNIVWNAYPTYSQNTSTVVWDWGDGTTTTGIMYPSHTYSTTGIFNICVSTIVSCGQTDTYCVNSNIFRTSELLTGPATINVIPQSTTEIKQTEILIGLNAYPNPIADELTIEAITKDNSKLNYVIIDALGRVVLTGNIENSKATINTSALEKGFYSLRITDEKGSSFKTVKLVK